MSWNRFAPFVLTFVAAALISVSIAGTRYTLTPDDQVPFRPAVRGPVNSNTLDEINTQFPLTRVDNNFEYYLGSGAAGDTFAIVMEPVAACSVYTVQYQWYDGGNMVAFVANYSQAARDSFPSGRASVRRGQTAVSPIGSIIRTFTPNTIGATQTNQWVTADVGSPFVIGNTTTGAADKFVVGFVKGSSAPHPLADDVTARGFTYTWLGGPLTTGRWGAYSGATATTLTDVAARCMVSYPWGSPIIIQNPKQLPNTYSQTGPWDFRVNLFYGTTITAADSIMLRWRVLPNGAVNTTMLTAIPGVADTYGCTFSSSTAVPVDGEVQYWVDCRDRNGRVSSTSENRQTFQVVAPTNGNANLLIVTDNLSTSADGDRFEIYNDALTSLGAPAYEIWDIATNRGIDRSVVMHGWNNILYLGWGNGGGVPAATYATTNPWAEYVTAGHNLLLADQDYFFGAGISGAHTFAAGDFAFDKFGIATCVSDPDSLGDDTFSGITSDPLTGRFASTPFAADPESIFKFANASAASRHNWNDQITVSSGTSIFEGFNDGLIYGARRVVGNAKLVLLPMVLEAAGVQDTFPGDSIAYHAGTQLPQFLGAVFSWWNYMAAPEAISLTPAQFSLEPNYPNPFNMTTQIRFSIPKLGKATLKIYNMAGQEVATLSDNYLFAGSYKVTWNANKMSSGVYMARLQVGNQVATQKLVLLK